MDFLHACMDLLVDAANDHYQDDFEVMGLVQEEPINGPGFRTANLPN